MPNGAQSKNYEEFYRIADSHRYLSNKTTIRYELVDYNRREPMDAHACVAITKYLLRRIFFFPLITVVILPMFFNTSFQIFVTQIKCYRTVTKLNKTKTNKLVQLILKCFFIVLLMWWQFRGDSLKKNIKILLIIFKIYQMTILHANSTKKCRIIFAWSCLWAIVCDKYHLIKLAGFRDEFCESFVFMSRCKAEWRMFCKWFHVVMFRRKCSEFNFNRKPPPPHTHTQIVDLININSWCIKIEIGVLIPQERFPKHFQNR